MRKIGFEDKLLTAFHDALKYGNHPTIDGFLEKKARFREIGSYIIAGTLLPCERHDLLFPQKNWYADLFDALEFDSGEPSDRMLSVVTLNYDRSLEHFLYFNINYCCRDNRMDAAIQRGKRLK